MVVDASAVLEALLRTPAAAAVERRLFAPSQTLHAPHLIDVEVAQVVRRYAANGEIDAERGRMALADLADFPLHRYPHDSPRTMLSTSPWPKRSTRRCLPATNASPLRPAIMRASSWCKTDRLRHPSGRNEVAPAPGCGQQFGQMRV